jgi:FtsP/CotA-like multicopper oxidase with cupredoxin domain
MRNLFLFAVLSAPLALLAQQASSSIDVPSGAHIALKAKGKGVQVYTCTENKWTLKSPEAKLLNAQGRTIGAHIAGPTWVLKDGSEVKGKAIANQPSPDAASVPWLLLQAVPGSGKGKFADITFIRRTETHGGAAPGEACTGGERRVPYTATYTFYTK